MLDVEDASGPEPVQKPPGCYSRFLSHWDRPADTASERTTKHILVPVLFFGGTTQVLFTLSHFLADRYILTAVNFIRFLTCLPLLIYSSRTKTFPIPYIELTIIAFSTLYCLLGDISAYGREELWTGSVLVADLLLLTGCRPTSGWFLMALTTSFLIVKTLEEGFGLGIYENIPENWTGTEPRATEGGTWFFTCLSVRILVFVLDFLMTRKFAFGMRDEQRKSERAVELAQEVAAALVRFDLETAESLVGSSEKSELNDAFVGLLGNLRLYRPYLPDALFATAEDDDVMGRGTTSPDDAGPEGYAPQHHWVRQQPAGSGQDEVTIVFTDIQSSTDIWEKHTSAMRTAMERHNDVMRRCIAETNGYEVKTIGDAFMVAFDQAMEGMRFGLLAQGRLVRASWPAALLEHPLCRVVGKEEDKSLCWRGLRVRIGVHTGPARLELNPTTRRTDYMGPTVNKAARVESASAGGAVAFTEEVRARLDDAGWGPDLQKPLVTKMGAVNLKGVGDVPLFVAIPGDLLRRQGEVEKTIELRRTKTVVRMRSGGSMKSVSKVSSVVVNEKAQHMTRNRLTLSTATMMHIRVDFGCLVLFTNAVDAVNEILNTILDGVERTEGLLCYICSNSIVASWNAGKGCAMHVAQSAKFVSHLYSSISGTVWERHVTVGMSSGRVLHGSLGNVKQRFVAAVGSGVEEGRALAEGAAQLGTFCLLAGESCAGTDTSLQVHTRPVALCNYPSPVSPIPSPYGVGPSSPTSPIGMGHGFLPPVVIGTGLSGEAAVVAGPGSPNANGTLVYELNLRTFSLVDGVWNLFDGEVGVEWGARYREAFADKDTGALLKLGQEAGDSVIEGVVGVMEGSATLAKPFSRGLVVPREPPEGWVGDSTGVRLAMRRAGGFR